MRNQESLISNISTQSNISEDSAKGFLDIGPWNENYEIYPYPMKMTKNGVYGLYSNNAK